MNAHVTPPTISAAAVEDALDNLEHLLARIKGLAGGALLVIEHELGQAAPAAVLDAILSSIEAAAAEAQCVRNVAWQGRPKE